MHLFKIKTLAFAFLALLTTLQVSAQRNTLLAYINGVANTDNSVYSTYGYKITTWGINPGIGYQFSNNFTIGIQGAYSFVRTPVGASLHNNFTMHNVMVGGFLRYTYYTHSIFFLYAQADIGYAGGAADEDILGKQGSYNGYSSALYPAVGAFITSTLAITLNIGGIGYHAQDWGVNYAGLQNDDRTTFNLGRQFSLGISKNFGLHHKVVKEEN